MSGLMRRVSRSLFVAAVLAVALAASVLAGPSGDVRVTTAPSMQIETSLAIAKDNTTVVAAFTDKRSAWGGANCSFNRSSDGGLTWLADDKFLPNITQIGGGRFEKSNDPAVAYSMRDKTFNYLCLAEDDANHRRAVVYERSSDGGQTWAARQIVQQSDSVGCKSAKRLVCLLDKDYLTVDNTQSSKYYGRIYATWVADTSRHKGWIAESHLNKDVGSTQWTAVKLIGDSHGQGFGPMIAAGGKKGRAYIGWCRHALAASSANCKDPNTAALVVSVSRSTSGGASWSQPSVAQTYHGPPEYPPNQSPQHFRINSFGTLSMDPSKKDDVRLVYTLWNGHDTDVMFTHANHTGGGNWSRPVPVGGGHYDQFFPWMVSLSDGSLWVCYYDEHYTSPQLDISCNRSATGASFGLRTRVTDQSLMGDGFIGDYIGVAAGPDKKPAVLWTGFTVNVHGKTNGDVYFGRP
jgi:hypothetical protein